MLRNADGLGGVKFSGETHYEGERFNIISVTRGGVGVQFSGKKALRNTGMAPKDTVYCHVASTWNLDVVAYLIHTYCITYIRIYIHVHTYILTHKVNLC